MKDNVLLRTENMSRKYVISDRRETEIEVLKDITQNSERLSWTFEEVDAKLKGIMEGIFHASYDASVAAGSEGNLMVGANCAGFLKVATAMMAQGITY